MKFDSGFRSSVQTGSGCVRRFPSRLILLLVACVLAGCQTDKIYQGQRVKASRWVNGRVVYILEDGHAVYAPLRAKSDAESRRKLREGAEENRSAAQGVVFAPLEAPSAASEESKKK